MANTAFFVRNGINVNNALTVNNTNWVYSGQMQLGNSTANIASNSTNFSVGNSTGFANLTPISLIIAGTVVNSTAMAVGANVVLTTSIITVGNSTVNTFASSTKIQVGTSSVFANVTGSGIQIKGFGGGGFLCEGDAMIYRSGGTTGVVYLNSAQTKYLFNDGGTYQMPSQGLTVGGVVTATSYNTSSDRRLKDLIDPVFVQSDAILNLPLWLYTFKDDENHTPRIGLMAQDVQKVLPEAVSADKEGNLKIDYGMVTAAFINASRNEFERLDNEIQHLRDHLSV